MDSGYTPSQTIGPFFHDALLERDRSELVPIEHPEAVRIKGAIYDGAGEVVSDAMVEVWQANPAGRYDAPEDDREDLPPDAGFTGFGRTGTDAGEFSFVTVKPGPVPGTDGRLQAPHLMVSIFARGLLRHLVTRVYFPDEGQANVADPVLSSIEERWLRETLIAREEEGGALRFDVHLQGEGQTVFFEI